MCAWERDEIKTLREMARMGLGIEAIALDLKRTQKDIRDMATALEVSLEEIAYRDVCPGCGTHYVFGDEGLCDFCLNERKQARFDKEEERERERLKELERADATLRKQRERRREKDDLNPRKGAKGKLLRALEDDGCFDEEED